MSFLIVGNVIKIENDTVVYSQIPEKFVYSNTYFSEELTRREIVVGRKYELASTYEDAIDDKTSAVYNALRVQGGTVPIERVSKMVKELFPENKSNSCFILNEGEFVVVETKMDGGRHGHRMDDTYPDGYHVTCRQLVNGQYCEGAIEIDFYQSGNFSNIITDIKPIRHMIKQINFL